MRFVPLCFIALLIAYSFSFPIVLHSQDTTAQFRVDEPPYTLSAYGGLGLAFTFSPLTNFTRLPEQTTTRAPFQSGSGLSLYAGIGYGFSLSEDFDIQLRAGFMQYNLAFEAQKRDTVFVENVTPFESTVRHTLDMSISTFGIEPIVKYSLWDNITLLGGFAVGLNATDFTHKEDLLNPFRTFENNASQRTFEGEIPDASIVSISGMIGVQYPFQMSDGFIVAPELTYSAMVLPPISGIDFSPHSLRFGVEVRFAPKRVTPIPKERIRSMKEVLAMERNAQNTSMQDKDSMELPLDSTAIQLMPYSMHNGGDSIPPNVLSLEQRTVLNSTIHPLLPYLFLSLIHI